MNKFTFALVLLILVSFALAGGVKPANNCVTKKKCEKKRVGPYTTKVLKVVEKKVQVPYTAIETNKVYVTECYEKPTVIKTPYKVRVQRERDAYRLVKQSYIQKISYKESVKYKQAFQESYVQKYTGTCTKPKKVSYQSTEKYKYTIKVDKKVSYQYTAKEWREKTVSSTKKVPYQAKRTIYVPKKVKELGWKTVKFIKRRVPNPNVPGCWMPIYDTKKVKALVWVTKQVPKVITETKYKTIIVYKKVKYQIDVVRTGTKTIKVDKEVEGTRPVTKYKYITVKYSCTKTRPAKRTAYRWAYKLVTKTRNETHYKLVSQKYKQKYWTVILKYRTHTVKVAATRKVLKNVSKHVIKYKTVVKKVNVAEAKTVWNYENRCTFVTEC